MPSQNGNLEQAQDQHDDQRLVVTDAKQTEIGWVVKGAAAKITKCHSDLILGGSF